MAIKDDLHHLTWALSLVPTCRFVVTCLQQSPISSPWRCMSLLDIKDKGDREQMSLTEDKLFKHLNL